jgi:hypothetical protein
MAFWIALAVLLLAVVGGIAFVVVRGLRLWRDMKRASALLGGEVDRISESSRQIEVHLAQADAASARLNAATDRLSTSRSQLEVQLAAVREARAQVRRTFWFVPGL